MGLAVSTGVLPHDFARAVNSKIGRTRRTGEPDHRKSAADEQITAKEAGPSTPKEAHNLTVVVDSPSPVLAHRRSECGEFPSGEQVGLVGCGVKIVHAHDFAIVVYPECRRGYSTWAINFNELWVAWKPSHFKTVVWRGAAIQVIANDIAVNVDGVDKSERRCIRSNRWTMS